MKIKTLKNCNLLPNLLKLIKFGVIVQIDELHKIFNYFLSVVIPFKAFVFIMYYSILYLVLSDNSNTEINYTDKEVKTSQELEIVYIITGDVADTLQLLTHSAIFVRNACQSGS